MPEQEKDWEAFHLLPPPAATLESGAAAKEGHVVACRALQLSRLLSLAGQHGTQFATGLIVLRLYSSSLLLVSLSGLLDSLVLVFLGSVVGSYVGSHTRLAAARSMYLLQNSMGTLSSAVMLGLLWSPAVSGFEHWRWGALALALVTGSANRLGAFGMTCVERQWTKALCDGDSCSLAALNSRMKCIDLACLVASPILIGLVMQYSAAVAVLVLLAWGLLCWLPEVHLLSYAQQQSPALVRDQLAPPSYSGSAVAASDSNGNGSTCDAPYSSGGSWGCPWCGLQSTGIAVQLRQRTRAWALYARQPAAPAALALALLYLTVCSWGSLMTAYLSSLGLAEARLALFHGLGAAMGILASLAFTLLCRWFGLLRTGGLAIWLQLACLLCGVLPSVAAALGLAHVTPWLRMAMLVCGLTLSRYGLWTFDLTVNQIIQESCDPGSLGAVNGVQGALQSLFGMVSYLAGALGPSVDQFVWLMAASCGVVASAAVLYTAYAVRASRSCQQQLQLPVAAQGV